MTFKIQFSKKLKEIFEDLNANERGLSEEEAKTRLIKYGKNEIAAKKISPLSIWLRQFKNSMIYLLLIAAAISLFLKQFVDALIIFLILLINSTLGFIQEYKTERILEKLKNFIKIKVKVRRDGKLKKIDQSLLVLGDIVVLKEGDLVPADLRIIKSENLLINEEVLTGESYPVEKFSNDLESENDKIYQIKNIAFSGSLIVKGTAEGLVIAAGKNTTFGKIAELTVQITKEGIFEKNILNLSKLILKVVLTTLAIVFILNIIIRGFGVNIPEFLLFSVALAISVIPEALPLIVTLTLSRGAIHLAKKSVAVKRLSAIEDLGNIEILCSDKTGTLTKNILEVKECYSEDKKRCFLFGLLASGFFKEEKVVTHDPFDLAIYQAISEEIKKEIKNYKKIWERPFDPEKRSNALIVENETGKLFLIFRGAVRDTLSSSSQPENCSEIINQSQKVGHLGQRTLGVAFKEIEKKESYSVADEKDLTYLGFFAFADSLKPETISTVKEAKKLGVLIKILTGDAPEVAEVVAKEAGLEIGEKVISGEEIDKMNDKILTEKLEKNNVFARILPSQKYRIIEILKKKNTVGFLGEGINDAPSLKLANVAIVVDSGADVSKEVGDIILLKRDLKTIIDGIKEGRMIFANVVKYIRYTLIANFGNFYSMAIISLIIPFLPLLAVQILLLNLLSDLPLVAVATDSVDKREIKKPTKFNLREIAFACVFLGLTSSIFDFTCFAIFYKMGVEMFRTLWFICSILTELVLIFSIRTRFFFLKSILPSLTLILVSILAALLTIFIPLTKFGKIFHFAIPSFSGLLIVFGLVIIYFLATETIKLIYYQHRKE